LCTSRGKGLLRKEGDPPRGYADLGTHWEGPVKKMRESGLSAGGKSGSKKILEPVDCKNKEKPLHEHHKRKFMDVWERLIMNFL